MKYLFFIVIFLSSSLLGQDDYKYTHDFRYACPGDYWSIDDEDIPLMYEPEVPNNAAQLARNTIIFLKKGTKVEILKSKGLFEPWFLVYVYNKKDQVTFKGWIFSPIVKQSHRLEKGYSSPY
jgi:hypothetical protein